MLVGCFLTSFTLAISVPLYAPACCMQRTHHPLAASQAHNQWSESRDRPLSPPSPIPAWRWHIYGALCSNVAITHCSWLPLDWMQPSPPSERWGSLISKYSLWKQELMNRNQGGINGHLKSTLFMPPSSPLLSSSWPINWEACCAVSWKFYRVVQQNLTRTCKEGI